MSLNKSLRKILATQDVATITVDIFDTVLYRDIWPEGLQFIETAERSLELFHDAISPSITPFEVYSWREYTRRELLSKKFSQTSDTSTPPPDHDVTLTEWLTKLVTNLAIKYDVRLSPHQTNTLAAKLVHEELANEKRHLKTNKPLLVALQSLKQEHPSLKIYFLSDMYLSTAEVRELLASANALDVFDGGITSTEAKQAKFSGKLYHHIHQNDDVFGESFDIYRNLHIGDSEHSDVNMALSAGSFAHHLYEPRFRRLRTRYNKYRLAKISKQTVTQDKDTLDTLLGCSDNPSSANILSSYGKLFALPLYSYLHHIANLTDDSVCYLFVSSEANLFRQTGKKLFGSVFDTVKVAPTLNRKTAIKALIYAMLQSNRPEHLSAIINTVRLGEVHGSRADIYDFLLTSKYPYSEMVVNLQTESDFCDSLWQDLLSADAQYLAHLEDAYNRTMDYLAQSDGKDIVICDVGWGSTIQVLVSQLLELTGSAQRVSGLYMGTHPVTRFSVSHTQSSGYLIPNVLSKKYRLLWNAVLWEYPYTNKPLYYEDEAKLQHIRQGMQDTFVVISQFKSNPKTLFSEVVQPEIARLFTSPTRREAQVLGSIRLDWGMNASQSLYIIDTSHSTLGMYRQFLLRPKASLKKITAPNQWTTGYIYYYRLYGMSLLLKVIGRLKHKRYI